MPDNTAAGTPAERPDERDGVTRGSAGGASGTTREGVTGREAPAPRPGAPMPGRSASADDLGAAPRETAARGAGTRESVPTGGRDTAAGDHFPDGGRSTTEYEGSAPAGPGARDGVLGGRDTAGRAGARGGAARESDREGLHALERDGTPAREGAPGPAGAAGSGEHEGGSLGGRASGGRLMAPDEGDKWGLRLQHAVAGFVDGPRGSVEEADRVLQEVSERFADAVNQRRRTLRTSWQAAGDDTTDTEQLRLALRDYRELAERLLRL